MQLPRTPLLLLLAAAITLLVACGDDSSGDPKGPVDCPDGLPDFETGDPDGHPDPLGAGPGESRAGRIRADQLPEDRLNLATWAEGDFVLANDRIAVIIEDVGDSDLFDPYGGRPVGIARVENGKLVDAGDFNEVIFGIASFLVKTESVTVMNDGSDGNAAVIRAVGPMDTIKFLGDLIPSLLGGAFHGWMAAIDWVMEPGSDAIDVYITVANEEEKPRRASNVLLAFFQFNRMPIYSEENGFLPGPTKSASTLFVDDQATSYAWLPPEGVELTRFIEVAGASAFALGAADVAACDFTRIPLGSMLVGGPGLPGLQATLARHRGEARRTLVGTVSNAEANAGADVSDVRVHVLREDGRHYARFTPAADGTFEIEVPNEPVQLVAFRPGLPPTAPITVAAGTDTVDLEMPPFATLRVTVTDENDAPIPARVQVFPQAPLAVPSVPAEYGEAALAAGRSHVAFATASAIDLRVEPGVHRVVASSGFDYELGDQVLPSAVAAGETREVNFALTREIDLPGVMCADYHIHTHRSPDSPDSPQLKLAGMIADGLEIAIRTDHEWIRDFDPVIFELGLEDFAYGVGGEELTTFAWGHFNFFPMEEDPTKRNGGALEWVDRLPPEVFDEGRARPEAPTFIVNHPRWGGSLGGYFDAAGFDRTTGLVARPEYWDEEFTLLEVFNDADFDTCRDTTVADWFRLLHNGRRVWAVGSSDSHEIATAPVGYPRTCLQLGVSDATALRAKPDPVGLIQTVTEAGRSIISGGAYVVVEGPDGALPGDDVNLEGEDAVFEVKVLAASWIRGISYLEVIVDGETFATFDIDEDSAPGDDPAVRLEQTVVIPSSALSDGSWIIFHAGSNGENDLLAPVYPGVRKPFAVSNPIYVHP